MGLAKKGVQQAVKAAARIHDAVRPPGRGVVVLAYHRVGGGTELEVDLDPGLFDQQMDYLAHSGLVSSLDEGLERLSPERSEAATVVTFDDGTVDFMEHALPSLVAHNVPATYYIATNFIESQQDFPDDGRPMSWSALREAVSTGLVTIGSHTHTHAVFDKLTVDEAEEELRVSSEMIEDKLGVSADHFAYPKGVFGGVGNEAVVARYHRSAALAVCGPNLFGSHDRLRLNRSPIQRSDGMSYFVKKVDGGMRLEGQLRDRLNRRRYDAALN